MIEAAGSAKVDFGDAMNSTILGKADLTSRIIFPPSPTIIIIITGKKIIKS